MLNGIDVGFGYTKAVAENGRSVSFPSAVLPEAQGESDLTRVLGSGEGDHRLEMRDDPDGPPKAFRVGYDALAMGAVRTWDTNASERSDYVLLALTAARLLACAGPVHLAVGVPLSLYLARASRESLRMRLLGTDSWVRVDQGSSARITVERVTVLPQAAGAFLAEASREPELSRRLCGIVDVGYRTTDYLLLRPGRGSPVPDATLSGSLDQGVGRLYERVAQRLGRERAALLESTLIERHAALKLPYFLDGEEIPLPGLLTDEGASLAEAIRTRLQRAWGSVWRDMGSLVITGGGGALLWPHLQSMHPLARLAQDPAFSNARGFLTALEATAARQP